MSKRFEARRTHGSFAELSGDKGKAIVAKCQRCGVGLIRKNKRYCLPCANIRYDETVAANKARYRAQRLAAKGAPSSMDRTSGFEPDDEGSSPSERAK